MEKLSEEQRFKVSKMSDERLRKKLVQAGYKEVDIIGLDRNALLKYVAQVILAETAYVPEQIADDGGSNEDGEEELATEGVVDADLTENRSLERRLWLEERKLEEQRLQREEQRLQRQLEERRWQEQKEFEERK